MTARRNNRAPTRYRYLTNGNLTVATAYYCKGWNTTEALALAEFFASVSYALHVSSRYRRSNFSAYMVARPKRRFRVTEMIANGAQHTTKP